jgi:flagellar biogenesis protein FliO
MRETNKREEIVMGIKQAESGNKMPAIARMGGLAGWLLESLRRAKRPRPRLELLERIALAPRQSLALVEAEGRRFLVATSPDGSPAFFALEARAHRTGSAGSAARVSW